MMMPVNIMLKQDQKHKEMKAMQAAKERKAKKKHAGVDDADDTSATSPVVGKEAKDVGENVATRFVRDNKAMQPKVRMTLNDRCHVTL